MPANCTIGGVQESDVLISFPRTSAISGLVTA